MKSPILVIFFYLFINSAFSQNDFYRYVVVEDNITTRSKRISSDTNYLPDDIIGTPYSDEAFYKGTIYENNESTIKDLFFRFNAFQDFIEVKKKLSDPDSKIFLLKKDPNVLIKFKDEYLMFDEKINGYYQILFIGNNYKLYKKLYKKYYKPITAKSSFEKDVLATYKDIPKYFLVDNEDTLYEFPDSKNKKIKLFGNKKFEIQSYVKSNRLDINDEDILVKVVRYFDTFEDASPQ